MKRKFMRPSMLSSILILVTIAYAGDKKLAQTGFQFLSVVSDARGAGLAGAMTTREMGSASLFFNPAGMAQMSGLVDLTVSQNSWFADISHNTFSCALSPANNRYGVIGVSLQTVDYGDIQGTVISGNAQGYVDTEILQPTAYALGLGYGKALSDMFSIGGQLKFTNQDLDFSAVEIDEEGDSLGVKRYALDAWSFDFGTLFKTGFKSLVFGMSVRNFSKEIQYVEEGFQLPLVFNLGISMNVMDFFEESSINQSLMVSVDASHNRSHPEQIKLGLEYRMKSLYLRSGYVSANDESGFSFGIGISYLGVTFDYAQTPFGVFDKVQRMTARFSL